MTVEQFETSPTAPLTPLLQDAMVGWEELESGYRPLLALVDTVLGVVPRCDRYLEIWPVGFRSYNLLVPNLLDLPVPVLGVGGPPPSAVGLAMYVASRTAGCAYCSAHSCSFALRRGAPPETLAAALLPDRTTFSRAELATIVSAKGLAAVPGSFTVADRAELEAVFGARRAEWVAMGAVLMGFLNTFMDVVGVELEQTVVDEVTTTMGAGWSPGKAGALLDPASTPRSAPPADGLRTVLRMLPLLPAVVRLDRRWQRGVPGRAGAVAAFLRERTGHDFPVLGAVRSRRVRRSIATVLRDNLDPTTSELGLRTKVLAGAVFAQVVDDERLAADVRALAGRHGVSADLLADAAAFAAGDDERLPAADLVTAAVLRLARAGSTSPAGVDTSVVAACQDSGVTAPALVELVTWLAVLQLLRRLTCYALPRP